MSPRFGHAPVYRRCPVCGQQRMVKLDGTMRQHRGDICIGGIQQPCTGAGLPPRREAGPERQGETP
jgi:hypothetical protein